MYYIRINVYGGSGIEFISLKKKRNDGEFPKVKELVVVFLKWVMVLQQKIEMRLFFSDKQGK